MHSSKGTALSAEEMLKITPPEVLRFLIMKNQPNKHIQFDPGLGILNLVDEYDLQEKVYFKVEEQSKGMKELKEVYELSQPYEIAEKIPVQLPYRHLVTLIQIGQNWEEIKKILIRTNQIPEKIDKKDENHLKQRVKHARFWLDNYAPKMLVFQVKKSMPNIKIDSEQKKFLKNILEKIKDISWDPEQIHNAIYDVSQNENIPIKTCFKTIYQIVLGQEKGPRAGFFLSNLEKEFIIKRINEAI